MRLGWVISTSLFIIHMDNCMGDMKARLKDLGTRMNVRCTEHSLLACALTDKCIFRRKSRDTAENWINLIGCVGKV